MRGLEDCFYPILKSYNILPLKIRNIIGKVYRLLPTKIRYGGSYNNYLSRIKIFQEKDINEVTHLSESLCISQVNYSIENIKFYLNYYPINNITDLINLPIIDKDVINNNPTAFLNAKYRHRALKSNTGGSSGTPFTFYIEKGLTRSKEAAHLNWYWGKYGFRPGDKTLVIRGKPINRNANYEIQTIKNNLAISSYNLNQISIGLIHEQVKKFKPRFIHAYPSSLLTFTKELKNYLNKNHSDFQVQAIFLGSEYLFEEDKKYLENFYQAKVVTWYGHSECLIHGAKCEFSGDYHFFPFYGYLELVDEQGHSITKPGIEGRIIATGFDNNVMPLIRYDTGDIGVLSPNKECSCGFKGTSLSKIVGRGKDYIVLKDKTKVTVTAFIFGQHFEEFNKIKEMQILQNEPGRIILKIVPLCSSNTGGFQTLKEKLEGSVNQGLLSIELNMVEIIEKTLRGKHRMLVQNLNIEEE